MLVHHAQVACVIPALGIKHLCCGFWVFLVAQHHVGASGKYFARNGLGLRTVYLYLHVYDCFSAAARYVGVIILIADDGGALCGSVAHGVWEIDTM